MRIYVEVHGCTASYGDAEIIRAVLERRGHHVVESVGEADTLFLVTCIVIDTTEQRMLSRLREFAKTGKPVVVAGCMASARKEEALKIVPDAIFIKPKDAALAADIIEGAVPSVPYSKPDVMVRHSGIRAIIQISEGCASSCTYCITRKARGKLVSYDPEKIIECCRRAIGSGCRELWITAQDTGVYRFDSGTGNRESGIGTKRTNSGTNLPSLLKEISEIPGDFRIRVGMMGVKGAMRSLEGLVAAYKSEKVYKLLHLPVQSGDDAILKRMARGYKAADFEKVVRRFRREFPDLVLSTDIIVGFPSESSGAFERTLDIIRRTQPDIVNVKRFSPRPGTKAYEFPERTPTEILKERSRKVAALCNKIGLELGKRYIRKEFSALVTEEGNVRKAPSVVARLDNYKPVVIREKLALGKRIKVKITGATAGYLIGEITE